MDLLKKTKDIFSKIILLIGIVLFFSVMNLNIRIIIGQTVNILMDPIMGHIGKSNFYIVVFIMALLTSLYSTLIQKYTLDQNKVIKFQEKMKTTQIKISEAKNNNNSKALKKLENDQLILMKEQTNIMKEQLKPMFYIIIFSLPLFMWIYYYIGQNLCINMCFPLWGDQLLSDTVFYTFQYWIYWYFITSLSFGQIFKKILINN